MKRRMVISKRMLTGIVLAAVILCVGFTGAQRIKASEISGRTEIYQSIRIESGDSLWSIAEAYHEEENLSTADYMEKLAELNHLKKDASIHAGQYLLVPVYKER